MVHDPKDGQTVASIITDFFSTEYDDGPTKCLDCFKQLPGHQSYQLVNSPDFIAFYIDRAAERLPLGGNILLSVLDYEYSLRSTTMHVGDNLGVKYVMGLIIFSQ